MKYLVDNKKLLESKAKAKRRTIINFSIYFIIIGYFILIKEIRPFDIEYKLLFIGILIILAFLIDKFLLKKVQRSIETLEIDISDNLIMKNRDGKTIDQIAISNIKSINRIKNGVVLDSKITNIKFFIPEIIEKLDDLINELKKQHY
ncbi:MAG: hypothetical protein GQ564_22790 [Bacteroidales bacterium]|nr:hypothetical protein [Bacteroidales bacterium]